MAFTNDGGDHEVMYRSRQLTLVWGYRGCRNGGAGVCGHTVEGGCDSLLMPVCGSVGGGGNLYGSGMGYHGNILLKTNAGAREAEIEGLIYWEGGQSHRQNT